MAIAKPVKQKVSTLRNKADKLLQELGRKTYSRCAVCGGNAYSCLHHFIPKSLSSALRYDWDNCVPVCHSCHFSIHSKDDPWMYERMIAWLGTEKMNRIAKKRRDTVKTNSAYYKSIIERLQKALE
jgi:hypothetical protein